MNYIRSSSSLIISTARRCLFFFTSTSLSITQRKNLHFEKLLYYHTQTSFQQSKYSDTKTIITTTPYIKKTNLSRQIQKQKQTSTYSSSPFLLKNNSSTTERTFIQSQKKGGATAHSKQTPANLVDQLTRSLAKLNLVTSETFRYFVNRHGHSKKHLEIILLHAEKYKLLSDDLYNLCIFRLSKVLRRPAEALQLFFELWGKDSAMLMKNSHIAALYALSDCFKSDPSKYSKIHMETLISEMEEKGFVLDGAILHPIVLGYLHFNLHSRIDEILTKLPQQKKLSEYGKIYLSLLLVHQNDLGKARQIYDEIQKMESDYTRKKFEPKKFLKFFYKTKKSHTENIKLASFNILLRWYSEIDITQAQNFFDEVNKNTTNTHNTPSNTDNNNNNTLQPDLVSFTTLIHQYIALAVTHYQRYSTYLEIQRLEKKPPQQTLECFQKALELLNALLTTTPFSPHIQTYVSFINASYKMGMNDELSYVLDMLKQRNPKDFDTPRFNHLCQKLKEKVNVGRFKDTLHYITKVVDASHRKTPYINFAEQNLNQPPKIDRKNANRNVR